MFSQIIHILIFAFSETFIVLLTLSLCIDVHEFGHYVFGKLLGLDISLIACSFFEIYRKDGIWHVRFKRYNEIFSGKVFFDIGLSENVEKISSLKLFFFSIGGIVFSVLLLLLACRYEILFGNWVRVMSCIVIGLSIIGDGITAVLTLVSRSYKAALLLLIYMRNSVYIDTALLTFIRNEIDYLNNKKRLHLYDCLAISVFSEISIQYRLFILDNQVVEYYFQKENRIYLFNCCGNVGMGFGMPAKRAVRKYFAMLHKNN